jgi:hypothetical protein
MDAKTLENWKKVKEALEASGKTNTHIYRRAACICNSQIANTKP